LDELVLHANAARPGAAAAKVAAPEASMEARWEQPRVAPAADSRAWLAHAQMGHEDLPATGEHMDDRATHTSRRRLSMSMTLYFHPLSSFCWKALIGLYELEIPFEKNLVDLSNEAARNAFIRLWPIGKFPVLRDDARDRTVPESTIILEYIDRLSPGNARLIPSDPAAALECRLRDRIYDMYIHLPMQKIVGDKLRPEGRNSRTSLQLPLARR
jgi:hypothetical protein